MLNLILKFIYKHQHHKTIKLSINKITINALIADTFSKAMIGLMFRQSLLKNTCMLFIFKNSKIHDIWMKNMNFGIDAVWLDKNKKIINYIENIKPCKTFICKIYGINEPSKYLIELNSGYIQKNKINKKTSIKFNE